MRGRIGFGAFSKNDLLAIKNGSVKSFTNRGRGDQIDFVLWIIFEPCLGNLNGSAGFTDADTVEQECGHIGCFGGHKIRNESLNGGYFKETISCTGVSGRTPLVL